MVGAYPVLSCRYLRRNIIIAQRGRLRIYHDPICSRATMEMRLAKLGFACRPMTGAHRRQGSTGGEGRCIPLGEG